MKSLEKYNCIFCKYRKLNKNIVKLFPFKQIDYWRTERTYKKEEKYNEAMENKYV